MPQNNLPKGKRGEDIALSYLLKKGHRLITRNFHSHYGEIDLITQYKNTLIFVEVKTRWDSSFGSPEEAVTRWKIAAITRTAEYFKLLHPKLPASMQIDVVAIKINQQGKLVSLEHLQNVTG